MTSYHDCCSKSSVTTTLYAHLYKWGPWSIWYIFTHIWYLISVHFGPCPHAFSNTLHFDSVFHIALQKPYLSVKPKRHAQALHASNETKNSFSTDRQTCVHAVNTVSCQERISATWQYNMLCYFPEANSSMISQDHFYLGLWNVHGFRPEFQM